jgi:hypothetical protein
MRSILYTAGVKQQVVQVVQQQGRIHAQHSTQME